MRTDPIILHRSLLVALATLLVLGAPPVLGPVLASSTLAAADTVALDFSRDPAREGLVLEGPDVASRIDWDRDDPPAFPGDPRGSLRVVYDAQAPTVRALVPLQQPLQGQTSFRLEADLVLETLDSSDQDFHVISFGLSNRATTGTNRTGTFPVFGDADVFDHVEASYFPNVTFFGGPNLTPTVFGADTGAGDAFSSFVAIFGPAADLGDNGPGQITELPAATPLRLALDYDACDERLALEVADLSTGEPEPLDAGLTPLDLSFLLASAPFEVDAVTVTAFEDRADFDPTTPALFAVVRYHRLSLEVDVLEVRATPRSWKVGRGGELRLHASEPLDGPLRLDVGGTLLDAQPQGHSGRLFSVDGAAFESAALQAATSEGEVRLVFREGCRRALDTLRLVD